MILSGISAKTTVAIAFSGILHFLLSHSRRWARGRPRF